MWDDIPACDFNHCSVMCHSQYGIYTCEFETWNENTCSNIGSRHNYILRLIFISSCEIHYSVTHLQPTFSTYLTRARSVRESINYVSQPRHLVYTERWKINIEIISPQVKDTKMLPNWTIQFSHSSYSCLAIWRTRYNAKLDSPYSLIIFINYEM